MTKITSSNGSSADHGPTQDGHVTNMTARSTSDNSNDSVISMENRPSQTNDVAFRAVTAATHHQSQASVQANGTNGALHANNGLSTIAANGASVRHGGTLSGSAVWFRPANVPAPITFLNHGSSADDALGSAIHPVQATSFPIKVHKSKGQVMAVQQPIGTRGSNFNPARPNVSFTTDVGPNAKVPGGHYLKLDKVAGKQVHHLMMTMNRAFAWESKVTGAFSPAPIDSSKKTALYLRFDDVRDAAAAFEQVETVDPTYHLAYVSQSEWSAAHRDSQHGTTAITCFFDGQVLFTCEFKIMSIDFCEQQAALEDQVRSLAEEFGQVLVFDHHQGEGCKIVYRVEYFKISAAKAVITNVTDDVPKTVGGWTITAGEMVHLAPELKTITPPVNGLQLMTANNRVITPQHRRLHDIVTEFISPTGRTAWGVDIHGNTVHLPPPKPVARVKGPLADQQYSLDQPRTQSDSVAVLPANYSTSFTPQDVRSASWPGTFVQPTPVPLVPVQTPSLSYPPGALRTRKQFTPDGPNKIYPAKIMDGTDVRTSIMVRNLPNELSFDELKRLLDHTSRGRYDFSYLRIDFNNGKNVGYGFVNFVTAEDIIPFHDMYFGKPWLSQNKYHKRGPPRLADLSYATIQGLDCLIDKMRNSSVMDENPDSRPKLWWTAETAVREEDIGEERPFPGVNNVSKKQRSRENAAQIGLYTHGSRQARSQRGHGHQSHFDRGTPAQIQEEAFWNTMAPHTNTPYNASYGYSTQTPYYGGLTPRGFVIPQGMTIVAPPQFPHVQQIGGYSSNHFYSMAGSGLSSGAPNQDVQFADPFACYPGQHVYSIAPPNGNIYNHSHAVEVTQYGPLNEVMSMPNGENGLVYHIGQEPQEMPAIPEETEDHPKAGANGSQQGPNKQFYDHNGYSYTMAEGHHSQ